MERGEVWEVALPVEGGREQAGHRPAIVLQDAVYGRLSPLVLAVPITSRTAATRFPATTTVEPDDTNGLVVTSVAMVFQLRALDRTRFVRRIGALSSDDLKRPFDEMALLIGQAPTTTP